MRRCRRMVYEKVVEEDIGEEEFAAQKRVIKPSN